MLRNLFVCSAFFIGMSSLTAAEAPLQVGFAEVDVSPKIDPNKPVYMAGFGQNRLATKVHDPIMVRAIVLNDGKQTVAIASVDVVGLFFPVVERIRAKLKGFDHVMVSSTHNHEGPDTLGLWGPNRFKSGVDAEYLNFVEAGVVKAINNAKATLADANSQIGTATGPELLRDSRIPEIKHDEIVCLRFHSPRDQTKPIGLVVEWNVHPELLSDRNTEVSADHVGYTVKYLQDKYKCPVVYLTGTVGGLMTNLGVKILDDDGKEMPNGTFEKTEKYGIKVGELAAKAIDAAKPLSLTPFEIRTQKILVPVENGLYRIAGQMNIFEREMYAWTGTPTPKEIVVENNASKPVGIQTEIGYWKLGELEIAAIPGEIYPELVLGKYHDQADPGADFPDAKLEPAIYTQLKAKHKMIVGLANDEIGYIIPKRQWDEKPPFCYGLKKSQYGEINSSGPDVAPVLCEAFEKLVRGK